ncbi:uncharacterized protein LOC128849481 [Cuculus canorus]|uniref:uncharacterized protein LOC128849481 n=1 Tax=Cuculus canorus TaxID=55661 RepID=UPI0023AA3444|nr:uncharacterized protein LOC128849481 [Cuculus canorus]
MDYWEDPPGHANAGLVGMRMQSSPNTERLHPTLSPTKQPPIPTDYGTAEGFDVQPRSSGWRGAKGGFCASPAPLSTQEAQFRGRLVEHQSYSGDAGADSAPPEPKRALVEHFPAAGTCGADKLPSLPSLDRYRALSALPAVRTRWQSDNREVITGFSSFLLQEKGGPVPFPDKQKLNVQRSGVGGQEGRGAGVRARSHALPHPGGAKEERGGAPGCGWREKHP